VRPDRPSLGLLVDRPPDPTAAELIVSMARWVRPVASVRLGPDEHPAAWFALSLAASADAPGDRPLAVWMSEGDDIDEPAPDAVLVGPVAPDEGRHVRVRRGAADLERWPWFPPFVRARNRRRVGLSDAAIDVRASAANPIPLDDVPTALALASAAVVDEEWLLVALALGTLCVATEDVVSSVVPEPGRDVVTIGDPGELGELASALATAPDQARRSRAGRAVASTLDLAHGGRRVLRSLGIEDSGGRDDLATRLSELGTPATSAVARRALGAAATLSRDHIGGNP
jgi:hypothetical protein